MGARLMGAKESAREQKETADLSTTLRSGRDDKFVELREAVHRMEKPQFTQNKFVISTGAKRSGEICGFFLVLTQTL